MTAELPESLDATFRCERLACRGIRARECLERQRRDAVRLAARFRQGGTGSRYGSCRACPQGDALRERLGAAFDADPLTLTREARFRFGAGVDSHGPSGSEPDGAA